MSRRVALLMVFLMLSMPRNGLPQDHFAQDRIKGLKGIHNVALLYQTNFAREVFSFRELADWVELGLHRNAPDLVVLVPQKTATWIIVNVLTEDRGGRVDISIYRRVKVLDSGQEISAIVWSDGRTLFGSVSKEGMRDSIDILLTRFAADYARSKRQ